MDKIELPLLDGLRDQRRLTACQIAIGVDDIEHRTQVMASGLSEG